MLCRPLIPPGDIISSTEWAKVHPAHEKRKLLYTWSPGISFRAFDSNICENIVTLIKCEDGIVLGGYTKVAWSWYGSPQSDLSCWLCVVVGGLPLLFFFAELLNLPPSLYTPIWPQVPKWPSCTLKQLWCLVMKTSVLPSALLWSKPATAFLLQLLLRQATLVDWN
jgi:hypothetical protein